MHEPEASPAEGAWPVDRRAVRSVQAVIVVLLVTMTIMGRSKTLWPVVTWPVYAKRTYAMPADTTQMLEVRVTTENGRPHRLRLRDLVEFSRHDLTLRTTWGSIDAQDPAVRQAYRDHLSRLVAEAIGDDRFVEIELWRVEWAVDPLSVPPLALEHPSSVTLADRFPATHREGQR